MRRKKNIVLNMFLIVLIYIMTKTILQYIFMYDIPVVYGLAGGDVKTV